MKQKHITPELLEEAKRLRFKGMSYREIGDTIGFSSTTVHRALDDGYARRRREQINLARRFRDTGMPSSSPRRVEPVSIKADVEARLAEIPTDTRNLTALILGDPIPNDPRRYWLTGAPA